MIVDLPINVWRSVRYVVLYQMARLQRKADRSGSDTAARYDRSRAANLELALKAIDDEITRAGDEE